MWRIWPWLTRTSRVALPPTSALYYAWQADLVHQFRQPNDSQRGCDLAAVSSSAQSPAGAVRGAARPGPTAVPQEPAGAA